MLDKSSADFDHALREIDRRSPAPLLDGVKDLDEVGVAGRDGTGSNTPGLDRERSKTDLRSASALVLDAQAKTTDRSPEMRNKHPRQYTDVDQRGKPGEVSSPACRTNVIVRTHGGDDRSGVCGVGYLGPSGDRACTRSGLDSARRVPSGTRGFEPFRGF